MATKNDALKSHRKLIQKLFNKDECINLISVIIWVISTVPEEDHTFLRAIMTKILLGFQDDEMHTLVEAIRIKTGWDLRVIPEEEAEHLFEDKAKNLVNGIMKKK